MSLTVPQLEQIIMAQGHQLEAQRRTIESQQRRLASLRAVVQREVPAAAPMTKEMRDPIRRAYRKGYHAGYNAGRRGAPRAGDPELRARTEIRQVIA